MADAPVTDDFLADVAEEARYQQQHWGDEHDGGKDDAEWFWTLGHIAGKAIHDPTQTVEKQRHRLRAAAALLLNWDRQIAANNTDEPVRHERKTKVCACGHDKFSHATTPERVVTPDGLAVVLGGCFLAGCNCRRFETDDKPDMSAVPVSRGGTVVGVFVPIGHNDAERLLGDANSGRSERALTEEELSSGTSLVDSSEQFDWLAASDEEAMAEIDRITSGVTGTDLPDENNDDVARTFRATPTGQRMFTALPSAMQSEVADALLNDIPRMPQGAVRQQTIRSPELAGPVSYAKTRSGHVVLYDYEPDSPVPTLIGVLERDEFQNEVAQWAKTHGNQGSDPLTSALLALVTSQTDQEQGDDNEQ